MRNNGHPVLLHARYSLHTCSDHTRTSCTLNVVGNVTLKLHMSTRVKYQKHTSVHSVLRPHILYSPTATSTVFRASASLLTFSLSAARPHTRVNRVFLRHFCGRAVWLLQCILSLIYLFIKYIRWVHCVWIITKYWWNRECGLALLRVSIEWKRQKRNKWTHKGKCN